LLPCCRNHLILNRVFYPAFDHSCSQIKDTHTYTYTQTLTHRHTDTDAYTDTQIHTHTYRHRCIHRHAQKHTLIQIKICRETYRHTYTYTYIAGTARLQPNQHGSQEGPGPTGKPGKFSAVPFSMT